MGLDDQVFNLRVCVSLTTLPKHSFVGPDDDVLVPPLLGGQSRHGCKFLDFLASQGALIIATSGCRWLPQNPHIVPCHP